MWFKKEFSICLIEFEAWQEACSIQEGQKTIKQQKNAVLISKDMTCELYISLFGELVVMTISPQVLLKCYTSAMSMWYRDFSTMSMTFNRCSCTITSLAVLTLCTRNSRIMPCNTGMISTDGKFATYCLLLRNVEFHSEPIWYTSIIVISSKLSSGYHNRYIICEKHLSMECAEVSN